MVKSPVGSGPVIQWELSLISHEVQNSVINQRAADGYVNATAMCKAVDRQFHDYIRLASTKDFVQALMTETGIPVSGLIQSVRGGDPKLQGTWVHPQVAINLAQWLSPEFAVKVSQWIFEWLSGDGLRVSDLPDHVRRYIVNRQKIPNTHFSMLNQMTLQLLAPLEDRGYILPSTMMPDIALGRMFSKWCREEGYDPTTFPTYEHEFVDGRRPIVSARLYPNELMTNFNIELENWMRDGRALTYFRGRDGASILPVQEIVKSLPNPEGALANYP